MFRRVVGWSDKYGVRRHLWLGGRQGVAQLALVSRPARRARDHLLNVRGGGGGGGGGGGSVWDAEMGTLQSPGAQSLCAERAMSYGHGGWTLCTAMFVGMARTTSFHTCGRIEVSRVCPPCIKASRV
jgi:hypothetical protein